MAKLVGYKGADRHAKAMEASRRASTNPRVVELADGSLVGAGDTILRADGSRDHALYGARGTTGWLSEVVREEGAEV